MVWYWDGPDAHHRRRPLDNDGRRRLALGQGRAGLRGRHRGAHQRRHRRPGGLPTCWASAWATARNRMTPHSLTLTMVGASLLWVGWFGFNAGSNLEANGFAALAFINTLVATAAATLSWIVGEALPRARPPCWAPLPAPWPAWWPSRRLPASSAPMGAHRAGPAGRLGLPVGCERPQEHAGCGRCAGRVRRARRRRHPGRAADRRVRVPCAGRHRRLRLRGQQGQRRTTRSAARSGSSCRAC